MNRRGFLGALLALPVAVKIAAQIDMPSKVTPVALDDFDYWHDRMVSLHRQAVERRTLSTFINGIK